MLLPGTLRRHANASPWAQDDTEHIPTLSLRFRYTFLPRPRRRAQVVATCHINCPWVMTACNRGLASLLVDAPLLGHLRTRLRPNNAVINACKIVPPSGSSPAVGVVRSDVQVHNPCTLIDGSFPPARVPRRIIKDAFYAQALGARATGCLAWSMTFCAQQAYPWFEWLAVSEPAPPCCRPPPRPRPRPRAVEFGFRATRLPDVGWTQQSHGWPCDGLVQYQGRSQGSGRG